MSPPQIRDKFVYISGGSRDAESCNLYTNKSRSHKQFYFLGAKCWNILPQEIRQAETVKNFSTTFKAKLMHSIEIDDNYLVDNTLDKIYQFCD